MILTRLRLALALTLVGMAALAGDYFGTPAGTRLSESALATVRGGDPFTYGDASTNVSCDDLNIVPYPYTPTDCSQTPNANIGTTSNGCVRCDSLASTISGSSGTDNVTANGTVDCSKSNKFVGTCNQGANGMGICTFPNMPSGSCYNTLYLYSVRTIIVNPGPP